MRPDLGFSQHATLNSEGDSYWPKTGYKSYDFINAADFVFDGAQQRNIRGGVWAILWPHV